MEEARGAKNVVPLIVNERRRYERLPLRVPLRFVTGKGVKIEAFTENISGEGFYCIIPDTLLPQEVVEAEFYLPAHNPESSNDRVRVTCLAQVVRIEAADLGTGVGIACLIQKFALQFEDSERES